ncbi:beta-lactamase class A [Rathayibacter oskolensis]|uniref:Beta-lactamase n=1 Tax=Rathayibacter oskolensis TaxID=1891671 RepID=A0A1X7PJL5_9MICO|nr:class A beta-lactamase [Rathayibacter oskolensis]SMH51103.1 beta-lactamase class A [Rathayibacter oskolensis]
MTIRSFAVALAMALVAVGTTACSTGSTRDDSATATASPAPSATPVDVSADLRALEAEFDARVGVSAVDTGSGAAITHRADERFGYASTIKALAAAEFLHDVPVDQRDEIVTWSADDVEAAGYSPVTSQHVDGGLPLSELAEAAVRTSDNTALNLVLDRIGGPTALDEGLTELGDDTTEVVDDEPALNVIEAGSTDDTSTPAAFTADLARILEGDRLTEEDRATLLDWMSGNATGDALIRAGTPSGWVVADKSGGAGGTRNDLAVVTPPGRAPIVVTVFTSRNDPEREYDDSLVARTAEIVLRGLQQ